MYLKLLNNNLNKDKVKLNKVKFITEFSVWFDTFINLPCHGKPLSKWFYFFYKFRYILVCWTSDQWFVQNI